MISAKYFHIGELHSPSLRARYGVSPYRTCLSGAFRVRVCNRYTTGCQLLSSPSGEGHVKHVKGRKINFAQKGELSFLRLSSSFSSKKIPDTWDTGTWVLFLEHCPYISLYFSKFSSVMQKNIITLLLTNYSVWRLEISFFCLWSYHQVPVLALVPVPVLVKKKLVPGNLLFMFLFIDSSVHRLFIGFIDSSSKVRHHLAPASRIKGS